MIETAAKTVNSVVRVTDFATVVAKQLGISETAAKKRIYRRIDEGMIRARKVLGSLVIDREEAERIIQGTDINEP